MRLLLPFLLLPIVEIALFIQVGGLIGVGPTIALVILSAVLGIWLMRRQGLAALADMQRSVVELRDPTVPMAHGAMVMLAGVLLVIPGFFTDALGLLLLIPPVRRLVMTRMGRRVSTASTGFAGANRGGRAYPADNQIIDADYVVVSEAGAPSAGPRKPSGWTQH